MVGCITHKCNLQECQNTHKHCQSNVSRKRVVPNGTAQPQSLCIVMVTIVAQKLYWFERLLQRGTPQMNRKRHTLDNIPSTNNLLLLLLFFSGIGILICREEDICLDVFFSGDWNHKMIWFTKSLRTTWGCLQTCKDSWIFITISGCRFVPTKHFRKLSGTKLD